MFQVLASEEVYEVSGNPFVAFGVVTLVLFLLYLGSQAMGVALFSIMMSYVICDLILNFAVKGGSDDDDHFQYIKIPLSGNEFRKRGHAYYAFIVGVILGSILGSWASNQMLSYISTLGYNQFEIAGVFGVIGGIVIFLDFGWRFLDWSIGQD